MCLHHQYSCSPPTLIIEKKSDILRLSLLSCCLEHRCQMFAVTTHPALSLSPTHTSTHPTAFRKWQQPLPTFKAADDDPSFAAQFRCIFCSPSSLPVFSVSRNGSSICIRGHTLVCFDPSESGGNVGCRRAPRKDPQDQRGKKASEEYQQGWCFNSTVAARGEALYLHRS